MLNDFVRDADGGLTLFVQAESPGKAKRGELAPRAEEGLSWPY